MFNPQNKDPFNVTISEVGLQEATVFKGFCKKHDDQIFSLIDDYKYIKGDKDQEFLFAYRALAKKHHLEQTKYNMDNSDDRYPKFRKLNPDLYQLSIGIEEAEKDEKKKYMKQWLKNIEKLRSKANSILKSKEYSQIETKQIVF